jgi:hypothetical protein
VPIVAVVNNINNNNNNNVVSNNIYYCVLYTEDEVRIGVRTNNIFDKINF